ncbi:9847_t:CDS:1, partial [Paraglomus occultum]
SPLFQNPSVINTLATRLPRPILDVATVLVRYKLIWDCIWTDICVLVFLVGCFIVVGSLFAG